MSRQSTWSNSDGLNVGFGTHTTDNYVSGKPSTQGVYQEIIFRIAGTEVNDVTPIAGAVENAPIIPADSLIVDAKLFVTTAFAGASATLDIGTYNATTGAIADDDGIDVAIATATLVDNAVVTCDGAQIGTVLAVDTVVYASYDTAAFTAGVATLVIRYIPKTV